MCHISVRRLHMTAQMYNKLIPCLGREYLQTQWPCVCLPCVCATKLHNQSYQRNVDMLSGQHWYHSTAVGLIDMAERGKHTCTYVQKHPCTHQTMLHKLNSVAACA